MSAPPHHPSIILGLSCICGEDVLVCPDCDNTTCRDFDCPDGGSPCKYQLDERARDEAVQQQVDALRGK